METKRSRRVYGTSALVLDIGFAAWLAGTGVGWWLAAIGLPILYWPALAIVMLGWALVTGVADVLHAATSRVNAWMDAGEPVRDRFAVRPDE